MPKFKVGDTVNAWYRNSLHVGTPAFTLKIEEDPVLDDSEFCSIEGCKAWRKILVISSRYVREGVDRHAGEYLWGWSECLMELASDDKPLNILRNPKAPWSF